MLNATNARSFMIVAAHNHIVLPTTASMKGHGSWEFAGDNEITAAPTNTNELATHLNVRNAFLLLRR